MHCLCRTLEKRKKIALIDYYGKFAEFLKYCLSAVQTGDIYIIFYSFYGGEEGHSEVGRAIKYVGNEIKTYRLPSKWPYLVSLYMFYLLL